jgi:hypothetical protein
MKRIHDAGVVHGGFGVFDILIANTKPFIVNFKNASEKVCERKLDIMKGAITPRREQFGCTELYRHCVDLQIWKPRTLRRLEFDDVPLTRPSDTGTFTFEGQRFPVEDVPNPAALAEKISDDSGSIEKSQTEAMHATVKHLLDFYREEFPGLEGLFIRYHDMRTLRLIHICSIDWHKQWLAAGSPLPGHTSAGGGDVATDLWNLQIPISSQTAVQATS